MSNAAKTATPAKLRDGSWGARVAGTVAQGDVVTITTTAGKSWQARVTRVVWSGDGVAICATASLDRPSSSPSPSRPAGRGRRTGCSCGSREDADGNLIPNSRNCWTCNHDA